VRNLFEELKRRNVVRVGAAYAVVAWLALQVVDTIAPLMAMPEWVPGFVLILVGVGFPIAVVFAWAYEITPEGLKKTEEVDAAASLTAETGRKIDRMTIAGLVVLVVFLVGDRVLGFTDGDSPASVVSAGDASIAVLPFVNLSSDPEQEYFSDGISEELLNVLAQVPDLRVAARTSSFQFKGDNRDITDIARELNVRHVLEGSVRKAGSTVRITAQLIDAADGFHLWSNTFDRDLQDIFAIQDEISLEIVDALRNELGLVSMPAPRDVSTTVVEAHEAYLRGRHLVVQRTRPAIEAAIGEFERAVELDPEYAIAHAELSLAWHLLRQEQYGDLTVPEVLANAEPHAFRAITLAEGLAEAQAARGFVEWQRQNFDQALAAFGAALEIKPNYPEVLIWTGNVLQDDLGRYTEARESTKRAAELDPLSIPALANVARDLLGQGNESEAEVVLGELAPLSRAVPVHIRGEGLSRRGRWAEGARTQLEALTMEPTGARYRVFLGYDFIRLGLLDEAEALGPDFKGFLLLARGDHQAEVAWAQEWVEREPDRPAPSSALGIALASAGDFTRARPILEKAFERNGRAISMYGNFSPGHAAALAVARRAVGVDNVSDVVRAAQDHSRSLDEAGITFAGSIHDRGVAAWVAGDRKRALELMATAVEEGALLFWTPAFWADLVSDPGFEPIRARYLQRQAAERADFLASVCTDIPWSSVWMPLEESCAAGSGGR
jgi:TolB-like protein/tetratricopeptide (TPR) repeat protein